MNHSCRTHATRQVLISLAHLWLMKEQASIVSPWRDDFKRDLAAPLRGALLHPAQRGSRP
jgi:hypothetical protein